MRFSTLALTILIVTIHSIKAQDFAEIDSIAGKLVHTYGLKGIALIGVKDGKVIYSKGFGAANETHKMEPSTPVYIASNTKSYIGLAMAQLIAQNKIGLQDPMTKYLTKSYFPEKLQLNSITIRDVISHSHGLTNDPITFRTSSSGEYPENLKELLQFTGYYGEGDTLVKKHRYSNFGYLLSGMIIEEVTGYHWKEYLKKFILAPMRLNDTSPFMPSGPDADKMALPYTFTQKAPLKQVKKSNTLHAAGGLFATPQDMGRWLGFHSMPEQLEKLFDLDMEHYFQPLTETEDSLGPLKINGYGYGWYFGTVLDKPFNFHTGGFSGHASFMSYMPEEKLGFFAFTNESSSMFRSVLQLVLLYYNIMTEHSAKDEVNQMFTGMIKSIYEQKKDSPPSLGEPVDFDLPPGEYYSDMYGTLRITKHSTGYELKLGNNLSSEAYKGEMENEVVAYFVPGSVERFYFEGSGTDMRIKFGEDFGYFYPKQ